MFELINRENKIFEILQRFIDAELDFVMIGGYAVSVFKHRFSVDADIVIRKEDKEKFEKVLLENKFKKRGFDYELVVRQGDLAIYELKADNQVSGYETVLIQESKERVIAGIVIGASEHLPGNEQFGTKGWSYQNKSNALKKFYELGGERIC